MNKTTFYAKITLILLAIGYAVAAVVPAHADSDKDIKGIVKQIADENWDRVGRGSGCPKISVSKSDSDIDMSIEGFTDSHQSTTTLETCGEIDGVIHCVGEVSESSRNKKKKDCVVNRLMFAPSNRLQHGVLVTEMVELNKVKKTQHRSVNIFGRKPRGCVEAYFDRDGEESDVVDGQRCESK